MQAAKAHLAREKRIIKAPNFNLIVFSGGIHAAVKIISKSTVQFLGSASGFIIQLNALQLN